jgi:hypothetical protein
MCAGSALACSSSSSSGNTTPPVDSGTVTDTGTGGGGDTGGGGGDSSTLPTISITSPMNNAAVTLTKPADDVPVSFTTTLTLMAPGTCGTTPNCGHIHVLVDGPACTPDGAPYDNATPAMAGAQPSPVNAILSTCPSPNGQHVIKLELHHDDHSPIFGADGTTVINATVSVTASGG